MLWLSAALLTTPPSPPHTSTGLRLSYVGIRTSDCQIIARSKEDLASDQPVDMMRPPDYTGPPAKRKLDNGVGKVVFDRKALAKEAERTKALKELEKAEKMIEIKRKAKVAEDKLSGFHKFRKESLQTVMQYTRAYIRFNNEKLASRSLNALHTKIFSTKTIRLTVKSAAKIFEPLGRFLSGEKKRKPGSGKGDDAKAPPRSRAPPQRYRLVFEVWSRLSSAEVILRSTRSKQPVPIRVQMQCLIVHLGQATARLVEALREFRDNGGVVYSALELIGNLAENNSVTQARMGTVLLPLIKDAMAAKAGDPTIQYQALRAIHALLGNSSDNRRAYNARGLESLVDKAVAAHPGVVQLNGLRVSIQALAELGSSAPSSAKREMQKFG